MLIELMVVIVILAILVAVSTLVLTNAESSAVRRTCQANMRTIDGIINCYYMEESRYPDTVEELVSAGRLKREPRCPSNMGTYSIDDEHCANCPDGHTYP